jgi:high-affinity iron transporter
MWGAGVLVFREVLEAALVISIVCAATRGMRGRGWWVNGGVMAGIIGAVIVALFAGQIADAVEGTGQELFNAGVLLAAVAMLAWHAIWMAHHGRELAAQMRGVGNAVQQGQQPITVLLIVVALAVLREGSEIVLFLFGMSAGGTQATDMAIGSAGGLLAGVVLGAGMYFGLLRVPVKHFFTVTNWLILLLAAGMAAQAAGYLIQADVLPALGNAVWDTSKVLSDERGVGQVLHTLIGYDARPAGMQVVFYVVTGVLIFFGMKFWGRSVMEAQRA